MLHKSLALFDLDYTLYKGNKHHVILDFPHFLHANSLFSKNVLANMTKEYDDYRLNKKDRKTFADNVISYYYEGVKGQSVKSIENAAEDWLRTSTDLWYDYAHKLVELMRSTKIQTIIISGSPIEPLELIKQDLGVDCLYATRGWVDKQGIFAGHCESELANAESKRRLIQTFGFDPEVSFAFGDSESDFPLLEAVNPKNSFLFRDEMDSMSIDAIARGWQVHERKINILETVKARLVELF